MSRPTTISLDQLHAAVESGVELAVRDLSAREARETSGGALSSDPIILDPTTMGYFPPEPTFSTVA